MKHARQDYERIQDPALTDETLLPVGGTPIGADEPVFLIRGKDRAAADAIRAYAGLALELGADRKLVDACMHWAKHVERWQVEHGAKVPDLPAATVAAGGDGA